MPGLAQELTLRKPLIRAVSLLHRLLYETTGGRLGGSYGALRFLLLRTTGARTGRLRTTPLLYLVDGDAVVLVASNGGQEHHPAWYFNLCQTPAVEVVFGAGVWQARARTADPAERARLWPLLNGLYPYDAYQARTRREIPVVILERS